MSLFPQGLSPPRRHAPGCLCSQNAVLVELRLRLSRLRREIPFPPSPYKAGWRGVRLCFCFSVFSWEVLNKLQVMPRGVGPYSIIGNPVRRTRSCCSYCCCWWWCWCWSSVVGCGLFVVGCWLLVVGCPPSAVDCRLIVVCCLLLVVCRCMSPFVMLVVVFILVVVVVAVARCCRGRRRCRGLCRCWRRCCFAPPPGWGVRMRDKAPKWM